MLPILWIVFFFSSCILYVAKDEDKKKQKTIQRIGNIGYTRRRKKTNQRIGNIGNTRRRKTKQKQSRELAT
jgi:uncharacterized membrane protein